ncbi:hypothetical protein [Mesobacillus foraminis]|uniref:hypothetical protein n=1 Tax=Mesobacillus foraminis TaxID=279826 RepID=UPI0010523FD4|nr:hypothetical protein [Mesobacillus foraminis]
MYPNHYYYWNDDPFGQDANFDPMLDERQFGGGPQMGPGAQGGPPSSPPPGYVPAQQASAFAVDPGGIRRCLFRYTYVWLRGFQQFWFFPIFVGRNSVAGWRWTGFRWVYFGISLRQIQSFTCV